MPTERGTMAFVGSGAYRVCMENTVLPALRAVMTEGEILSFDQNPLHWYAFRAAHPKRSVVLLHGYTESARKYAEMIYYFWQADSDVYIFDQRGHGKSYRPVPDLTLTHVDRFEDYVRDLECVMDAVVPRDLPLVLYAHSMGGAVGTLYLEKHPDVFEKAVLSSPMIAPDRGGYPLFVSQWLCRFFILAGKGKSRIFLSQPYAGKEEFADSCSTSEARFAFYEAYRRATPTHQNCSPTYRWTLESLGVTAKILRRTEMQKVYIPILLCRADADTVVLGAPQEALAAGLPNCTKKIYPAKHEIYNSPDDVLGEYVEDILEFIE